MALLHADAEMQVRAGEPLKFELSGWIDTAPFEDLAGIRIDSAEHGRSVLTMPFRLKLAQGGGVMHGGAMTTLADTAVAMAIKSRLPEKTIFATTELQMQFLAPVVEGVVRAEAAVNGPEGRSFFGEARLYDETGKEVALFRSTFRVARGQGFDD